MKLHTLIILFSASFSSFFVQSQGIENEFDKFDAIYEEQLGSTRGCEQPERNVFRVCSSALKNDGNAPYILHHNQRTQKVVVLIHGLSDSPFFFRSIAKAIHGQGHNVVVALLPGHGKVEADADMQDYGLSQRWRKHVSDIMAFSSGLGVRKYLGGFSTGGALGAEYILLHPGDVAGLLLYSGALALDSGVEGMAKIWGIQWLAKILDGEYQTKGPNPYKYPGVARFSAFELLEVIFSVRELIEQGKPLNLPIFSAHSAADTTTPLQGIKDLMAYNKGSNELMEIPASLEVCHADTVVNEQMIADINFDASGMEEVPACKPPKANPMHKEMLALTVSFVGDN